MRQLQGMEGGNVTTRRTQQNSAEKAISPSPSLITLKSRSDVTKIYSLLEDNLTLHFIDLYIYFLFMIFCGLLAVRALE